ncbi:helix-turn-helix transcriptional regulator [Niabella terrae]
MAKVKYNRIKTVLAEVDKKNSDLAKYMKVHETTVSNWCTNTNQPSIQDLFKIAKFVNKNVRILLVATKPPDSSDD